jgi:nucleoside-diphosphate-sugar epimerase
MNLLLTGANGFLGKIIVKSLEKECQIIKLSRNSGDYQVALDYTVPDFKECFDLVIHSAGKAHSVPKDEEEKKQFYDVNVTGTINLLKGLEKVGVPKEFVFISSVSVYGKEFGENISEKQTLAAKDAYGLSKIEAEAIVTEWCLKHNSICTILRLPLLVGENPPGNLGAMIKAIDKGYYFNIGGGKARKSMVLAEDVASFIMRVAPVGGIYNLTDGFHPSFYELSLVISKNKGMSPPLNLSATLAKLIGKFGDVLGNVLPINSLKVKKITSDLTFNDAKARTDLNWNPRSVIDYLKKHKI